MNYLLMKSCKQNITLQRKLQGLEVFKDTHSKEEHNCTEKLQTKVHSHEANNIHDLTR